MKRVYQIITITISTALASVSFASLALAVNIEDQTYVSTISGYTATSNIFNIALGTGDINGDGYDDVLFGDDGFGTDGGAFLIYGSEDQLADTALDDTAVVQILGETAGKETGASLAIVGDVNGDGYDDILIGDEDYNDGVDDTGAAYLIYGQATKFTNFSLDATGVVTFEGEADADIAGRYVSPAGDVNADGFADFLIGAGQNDDEDTDAGKAYLLYGSATKYTGTVDLGSGIAAFTGEDINDRAGTFVHAAGDMNGDGYDDFVIATPSDEEGGASSGSTYLLYGAATKYSGNTSLSDSAVVQFTGSVNQSTVVGVGGAADVNGDGYSDLMVIVGDMEGDSSFLGGFYLLYGAASKLTSGTLSTSGIPFIGEYGFGESLLGVRSAGDRNQDGYDEILFYGGYDTPSESAAYIIPGKSTKYADITNEVGDYTKYEATTAADYAGQPAGTVGDLNGDGYPELSIGTLGITDGVNYILYSDYKDPFISLAGDISTGNTNVMHECGTTYTDLGASQSDNLDTSITGSVSPSNSVNVNTLGAQTLNFESDTDASGNTGTITRTVTVEDTTKPTVSLVGEDTVNLYVGDTYSDNGVTATDTCDSSVSVSATTVDTATAGTSTQTYTATDDSGNSSTISRTVVVKGISKVVKKEGKVKITYTDGTTKSINPFKGKKNFRVKLSSDNKYIVVANSKQVRSYNAARVRLSKESVHSSKLQKQYYRLKVGKVYGGKSYHTVAYANTHLENGQVVGKLTVFRLTGAGKLKKKKTKTIFVNNGNALTIKYNKSKKRIITTFGKGSTKQVLKTKLTKKGKLKQL